MGVLQEQVGLGQEKGSEVEPSHCPHLNSLFGFATSRLIWARERTTGSYVLGSNPSSITDKLKDPWASHLTSLKPVLSVKWDNHVHFMGL